MTDRDALLAAVRAAPDDDLPRLVLADWLDEHGDPARAEFIRLDCERWRTRERRRYPRPLKERVAQLRAAHDAAWRAALPALPGVAWGRYWRGFVSEARFASPAALIGQAAAAFAAAPVQFVQVAGVGPADAGAVCRVPPPAGLHGLRLDAVAADLDLWRTLVGGPWFGRLRHLIVCPAADPGVALPLERNDELVRVVLSAAARTGSRLRIVHLDLMVGDEDPLQRAAARAGVKLTGLEAFEPL